MFFTNNKGSRHNFSKDPAVIKYKNKYYLYHSIYTYYEGREVLNIGIAVSEEMENWEIVGQFPLTQKCEQNGVGAPGAIVLDGVVHLFYQSYGQWQKDAICHATSTNGVDFTKDESNPIFAPSKDWSVGRAIDADVCVFGNKLMLYFATRDDQMRVQMIGVAAADINSDFSKKTWVQLANRPILKPELEWEGECIEAAATLVRDGKVFMFYGGAYNCKPQQIGVAVSEDGVNFTRVFDRPFLPAGRAGEWNSSESGHPYVFEDESGRIYLFYQGSNDYGHTWYITKEEISFQNGVPIRLAPVKQDIDKAETAKSEAV